ncbi:MAG TPA: glycoside hydrolase family 3 N-terminal domain-containing protein, partial [Gemmatimonadales bacterium]|nr:glycoside hydrolase family 3 N-terminal domain-containing protein [Gemmatimonadales bacterium]
MDARVRDLLGRMTLEEKFWQLFMIPGSLDDSAHDYSHGVFGLQISPNGRDSSARAYAERVNGIQRYFVEKTRLGIPIIAFDEALHGVGRPDATSFPQSIALAATWDTALVRRVAGAIAAESRSRGIRQVLSPVVNLGADPRWGRTEETYGEDPLLASAMGVAYVRAMEDAGVVATPKHFVANYGEGGRDSYPVEVSRRKLEEVYFPPFKAAIGAGRAQSVMSAYNSVDGTPASQSRWLLTDVLRGEWRFTGFVISDAAATGGATVLHLTENSTASAAKHALEAGLDVIFQSSWEQHRPYLAAFQDGTIPDSIIDKAVARVLRAKFELGLFEHPYVDADSAQLVAAESSHRTLARDAARESIVLLKNERKLLPIDPGIRQVAVIGEDATQARLGGYSGPGIRPVSILEGIKQRLGGSGRVMYAPGPGRESREVVVVPAASLRTSSGEAGLRGEYFDNPRLEGAARLVRVDSVIDFAWTLSAPGEAIPLDWYSVRWNGRLKVPAGGVRHIGVEGSDGYRLYVDGRVVIDDWQKRSAGSRLVRVTLKPGTSHELRLEYFETVGNGRVRLMWDAGVSSRWKAQIDSAVAIARKASVAVVVAGIEEGEFRDRSSLKLPGRQEEMIRAVAATGTPVVVVLVGGSAVTMSPWLDRVRGVLDAWYPGEEGGHAVADILFGDANPAGRLPITFPLAEGQLPLYYDHKPTGRGNDYLDLTGLPLFPFGFGLSYTSFEYSDLRIEPAELRVGDSAVVRLRVWNTGSRAGDEVVQLYLRDVVASVARPVAALEGFRRIHLEPGAAMEVTFPVGPEQ